MFWLQSRTKLESSWYKFGLNEAIQQVEDFCDCLIDSEKIGDIEPYLFVFVVFVWIHGQLVVDSFFWFDEFLTLDIPGEEQMVTYKIFIGDRGHVDGVLLVLPIACGEDGVV